MLLLDVPQNDLLIVGFIVVALLLGWIVFEFRGFKERVSSRLKLNPDNQKLQLQAYERLTLFAERCNLISLTTRLIDTASNAKVLQHAIIENIKSEYEYNVTQQIYVSSELWKAITKLKEQNSYIINQLASNLPANTSSLDFAKVIIEYTNTQNADLSKIVLEAIQFESKKILHP